MAPHSHRRPVYQSLLISRDSSCSSRLTSKNGDQEGLQFQTGLSWLFWHWRGRILLPNHRRGPINLWRGPLRLQTPDRNQEQANRSDSCERE